jgi:hypothetical protein
MPHGRDKGDTTGHHTDTGHPAAPEILRFEFDRSSKAKVRQESEDIDKMRNVAQIAGAKEKSCATAYG